MQYGKSLLNIAVRAAASFVPGGLLVQLGVEEFGPALCEALWKQLKEWSPLQRRQALEQIGQIGPEEARRLAEEGLRGSGLTPELRAQALEYLAAIPMAARRTLVQTSGSGGALSLPQGQMPRTASELLRFLPARPPRFRPGESIPGHDFRLERLLGQGGFGEVWLAGNPRRPRERPRALKFCLDPQMRQSLEREIDLLDRIQAAEPHPGIVRLLETALNAEPPFLIYEYIDGGDLQGWLAAQPAERPAPRAVAAVLVQLAEALAFAHRHGIVHRDLKPSNVLLDSSGAVKIADFGIGSVVAEKELAQERSRPKLTQRQTALQGACTPMYADRAQRRGEEVDARADVYALGVMAYQLLLGDVTLELSPYFREELEKAEVPASLIELVARCLTLPERRYADGAALLDALQPIATELLSNGKQTRTVQPPPVPPVPPESFGKTFVRWALILLVPFVLVFGAWVAEVQDSAPLRFPDVYGGKLGPQWNDTLDSIHRQSVDEVTGNIVALGVVLWLLSSLGVTILVRKKKFAAPGPRLATARGSGSLTP